MQRVSSASVSVGGDRVAQIEDGLLVLLGVAEGDSEQDAAALASKIAGLRVFENQEGRFDRSLLDVAGEALVVSQFTLLADTRRGNRPSFTDAAPAELAAALYGTFCDRLAEAGVPVRRGVFGARMAVALVNDGPVTILLEAP